MPDAPTNAPEAELDATRAKLEATEQQLNNYKLQLADHVNARKRMLQSAEAGLVPNGALIVLPRRRRPVR